MSSTSNYLSKCKELYKKEIASKYGAPIGCSFEEISDIEQKINYTFPDSYREFLLWMGNDKNGVLRGSDWFLDDVIDNTDCLEELIEDNGLSLINPDNLICFFMHQGYMVGWFYKAPVADDPDCYFFSEGAEPNTIQKIGKFSEFLLKELNRFRVRTVLSH